jgi:hypothetical protein
MDHKDRVVWIASVLDQARTYGGINSRSIAKGKAHAEAKATTDDGPRTIRSGLFG